jgi:hypothetical protein
VEKLYKLHKNSEGNTQKTFFFEGERFLLKKQEVIQSEQERIFEVNYPNYQAYSKAVLPTSLSIQATQKKGKTNISIDYNSVTFNDEFSFAYSVPEGYERIFID